jgi:Rhomboid family
MGSGRSLGLALAGWLEAGSPGLDNGVALGNRLVDGLGADQTLAGPLRDLARRPQLRQALASSGTARRAALSALVVDLRSTYAPAVLAELVELLEVGLGVGGLALSETAVGNGNGSGALDGTRSAAGPASVPAGRVVVSAQLAQGQGPEGGQGLKAGAVVPPEAVGSPPLLSPADPQGAPFARRQPPLDWRNLRRDLLPLGPGLALGAAMALVLAWLAGVLDEELLAPRQWSAGLALVLALAFLQIATLAGPLSILRRSALLLQGESGQPRFAWRWVSAPWLHRRNGEALVNVLLLLLILGPTPLGLDQVVLRYTLTSLACLALAALMARHQGLRHQNWGGASGAVGALVGLAVGLSLLRWRVIGFSIGEITVPAWVLLVVVGSLQLAWILPRAHPADPGRPGQRLLASPWWWGLMLGLGWALVSWGSLLLQGWLRNRPG